MSFEPNNVLDGVFYDWMKVPALFLSKYSLKNSPKPMILLAINFH